MDTKQSRNAISENESIQEGLEHFLESELGGISQQENNGADAPAAGRPQKTVTPQKAPMQSRPQAPANTGQTKNVTKPAKQSNVGTTTPKAEPALRKGDVKKHQSLHAEDDELWEEDYSYDSEYYEDDDDDYVLRRRRIYDEEGDEEESDEDEYDEDEEEFEEDYEDDGYEPVRRKSTARKSGAARRSDSRKNSSHKKSGKAKKSKSSAGNRKKSSAGKAAKGKKRGRGRQEEKQKKGKLLKVLIGIALFLLLLFILMNRMVNKAYKKMNYEASEELADEPMIEEGVINVLLIGNDSRKAGDDGRSDAMILVSVNQKEKTLYMTSFLRDMYVTIPGHGQNRLNAAYAYGGATLLCQTLKENFDIEVNRYAIVNFQAFAALVDAVGGVDIDVTSEEVEWINAYLNEYNELEGREMTTDYLDTSLSGVIHLNGPQALAYSRNRYIGTDFGRTERQRKVLSAIMKKAPMAMATNSEALMDGIFPYLTTNLTQKEVSSLSMKAGSVAGYENRSLIIPADGTWSNANIDGKAVLQVDFEANKKILKEEIYGEKQPEEGSAEGGENA